MVDEVLVSSLSRYTGLILLSCSLWAWSPLHSQEELRVLFIGNSLTYTNNLPHLVEALAAASNRRLIHQSLTLPNYSLEDHWVDGNALKLIRQERWDIVVLQQGPSGLEESRELLIKYSRLFDREIHKVGARTALYMVWPSVSRFQDFDRVTESYTLAADDIQGILLPAGTAWLEAWKLDAKAPLYSEDGFHPSAIGSYLVAFVFYERLFGGSFPKLSDIRRNTSLFELTPEQYELLRRSASETNRAYFKEKAGHEN